MGLQGSINLRDFCYAHLGWMGRGISRAFRGVEHDLDAANMKIHPEVYFSIVGFIALLSLSIPSTLFIFYLIGLWPMYLFLPISFIILPFSAFIPLLVIMVGVILPKTSVSNKISGLKIEIPYASMYISVMTSGGLSPYESFLRMHHMDLLPNMQKEVTRIESIVMSTGVDPLSAMEQAAKVVNMNDYKELLLGYASAVRTGGDTLHYLFNQTKSMFRRLSTRIKSMGENMGMIMEAYTIIGILGVLGLFLIYVIGMSLPNAGMSISSQQFFLFSFVVLPLMSIVFIYFCDTAQISYPISNWKTYLVFAAFLPVGVVIGTQIVLPCFDRRFLLFPPIYNITVQLRKLLNFAEGTEAAIGMVLTLVLVAIPGFAADFYYTGRESSLQLGITQFLRDLVETRKSGLSPERCIEALGSRDYKGFSKHLRRISMKLSWGYPIRQIYDEFRESVRSWLALVNIYLLIDTIEVGGGSEESLETLAEFSESTKMLEDEKRAALMPMTIVPYFGAGLLTASTVMFLQFFGSMSTLGVSIQNVMLYKVLLTPLALHSFLFGLVTGKISAGRVSAGFKHSMLLMMVALGGIWAVSNMSIGFSLGGP